MANPPPPPPSGAGYGRGGPGGERPHGDPFSDRQRQTHFQEPERPYHSTTSFATPYESTSTLPQFDGQYADDDYAEKVPLTTGQNIQGGFYPP
jgi:chitin synthase